jgi:thiamine biosynthesis lipoprotein
MVKKLLKKTSPLRAGILGLAGMSLALFLIGFFIGRSCDNEQTTYRRTQILLGTVVDIQVRDTDEKKADGAITKAFAEIKRIDDLFSTYNEESPVWKLNNSTDSIISVDAEIYNLIVLCDSITKLSGGDFDVSLDNLIQVWGFYSDNPHLPAKEGIDSALLISGWHNIRLADDNKIIRRRKAGLNFGAIAKGYAVDNAVEILRAAGVKEALVNAGGEIKSIGNDWVIGVQHPGEQNEIINRIKLNDLSVATSGDYENYFEQDGVRYHHILNPGTGFPAKGLQSVTVIHKDNAFADGLATAVFVLGREKGINLVERLDKSEAMIIDEAGKMFYSSGFKKYLID